MRSVAGLAAVACVVPLAAVLIFVTLNGIAALNLDLLTKPSRAQGIGGGAAAAILGSIQMVGDRDAHRGPVRRPGRRLRQRVRSRRSGRAIRFAADVLVGIPSILIGIFVFTFLVLPFKQYNAFAGSVALAVIMVPVIMRTTEEILKLVPASLREASLALGIPAWRTVLSVVLRTGLPGILTGIMLAVARAAGETAPLLFTALGSRLVNVGDFGKPMDAAAAVHLRQRAPALRAPEPAGLGRGVPAAALRPRRQRPRPSSHGGSASAMREPDPMTTELRPAPSTEPPASAPRHAVRHPGSPCGARHRPTATSGRIEIEALNVYYGAFRAVRDISLTVQAARHHRHHRPVGLRQEHVPAHPQPDARADAARPRRGLGPARRRGHLRPVGRSGRAPARRRHGLPATQPVPDDVDLRQRRRRPAPDRPPARRGPRRGRRAVAAPGGAVGRGQGQAQVRAGRRCRAASSSACASPARSPSTPR